MRRDFQVSYLAGLFDGEGSFSIQIQIRYYKNKPSVRINPRLTMTLRYGTFVLNDLKEVFGGQIYNYSDGSKRWNLSKKNLILLAVKELLPYLRIKKEIAENFIKAVKLMPKSRKGVNLHDGNRVLDKLTAIRITEIAFTLNNVSEKRTDMKMNTLNKIKNFYET